MNILPQKYFKQFFERLNLTWQFASITSRVVRFFEHRYFTNLCSDKIKMWGIFNYVFVANLPESASERILKIG